MTENAMETGRGAAVVKRLDFRAWSDEQRHLGSIIVIVAVSVLLVIGIAVQFLAPDAAGTVLWALFALVLVALAYEAGAVYYGLNAASATADSVMEEDAAEEHAAWAPPGERADDEPAGAGVDELTLRCGVCATQFDVRDDGTRPLYHSCPNCGTEGVLRADEAAPPREAPASDAEPDTSQWARPEPQGASAAEAEHASAPTAPPVASDAEAPAAAEASAPAAAAAAVKRIKLRCPGCKHVFPVEDDGSRPLRTRCPSCSRLGEIRG